MIAPGGNWIFRLPAGCPCCGGHRKPHTRWARGRYARQYFRNVGNLWESLEWTAEIVRRIEAVERGESRLIPGDEVEARIREALGRI